MGDGGGYSNSHVANPSCFTIGDWKLIVFVRWEVALVGFGGVVGFVGVYFFEAKRTERG
jgi:hypothetical protein